GVDPRFVFPRVVAELAHERNGVKNPEPFARPYVEAADVSLHVALTAWHPARSMRRADNHHIARDDRRRMEADLSRDEIDLLIVIELQVDDTIRAEGGDGHAGLCVERDQSIARRDVQDPF